MKTILTSELSRRATTDTDKTPFASVVSISALEGRSELSVGVLLQSGYGREEKTFLLPLDLLQRDRISLKNIPYEIDSETLSYLENCHAVAYALRRAYGIISYGASSYKKLFYKLREKGVDRDVAEQTVEIIRSKGYIDEDDLACRVCELCLKKYWGRSRIIRKLREDGYCDEAIGSATDFLDSIDFAQQCAMLIEKRYMSIPSDQYEVQKMFASIARYGYSGSEIREAVRIYNESN